MKKIKSKLMLVVILALLLLPITVLASDEEKLILKQTNEDYLIYVKQNLNSNFKFTFSNVSDENANSLVYINSIQDSSKENIAYINSEIFNNYFADDNKAYLYIENMKQVIEINLEDSIEVNYINALATDVESITKRIAVNTTGKITTTSTNEGVETTLTVGKIDILDNAQDEFSYGLLKVSDSVIAQEFLNLINNQPVQSGNYEKIMYELKVNELYRNIENYFFENDKLSPAEDFVISQPSDAKEGEKYIVYIFNNQQELSDIQILTCTKEYSENYQPQEIIENKVVEKVVKLPITYDNVILFVCLGVVVILISVTLILRNRAQKNEKNKNI